MAAPLPRLGSPSTPERWSSGPQLGRGRDWRYKKLNNWTGEAARTFLSDLRLRSVSTYRDNKSSGYDDQSQWLDGCPIGKNVIPRLGSEEASYGVFVFSQMKTQPGGRRASPRPMTAKIPNTTLQFRCQGPHTSLHVSTYVLLRSKHFNLPDLNTQAI